MHAIWTHASHYLREDKIKVWTWWTVTNCPLPQLDEIYTNENLCFYSTKYGHDTLCENLKPELWSAYVGLAYLDKRIESYTNKDNQRASELKQAIPCQASCPRICSGPVHCCECERPAVTRHTGRIHEQEHLARGASVKTPAGYWAAMTRVQPVRQPSHLRPNTPQLKCQIKRRECVLNNHVAPMQSAHLWVRVDSLIIRVLEEAQAAVKSRLHEYSEKLPVKNIKINKVEREGGGGERERNKGMRPTEVYSLLE